MRVVVGYEEAEEGRVRRPIYADQGPGRARQTNQGGSYGGPIDPAAATVLTRGQRLLNDQAVRAPAPLPDDHMKPMGGPIERRQITPEELAARRAAEERPSPIAPRPFRLQPRKPNAMLDQTTAPASEIARLAVDLPCPTCSHAPVCQIRAALVAVRPELLMPSLPGELAAALRPTLTCSFFDSAVDGRETVTPPVALPAALDPQPAARRPRPHATMAESARRGSERSKQIRALGKAAAAGGGSGCPHREAEEPRDPREDAPVSARAERSDPGRASIWIGGA